MKSRQNVRDGEKTSAKLFELLELVVSRKRPVPGKQAAALSGLPVSTTFRLLKFLTDQGYLQKTDQGYSAGLGLVRLGMLAAEANPLLHAARPFLLELSQQTMETVHLAQLQGTQAVYVDKVEGSRPVRMCSLIGHCAPLYCTGVGKAILAFLPPEEAAKLIYTLDFEKFTETTLVSRRQLIRELNKIRVEGYALDQCEHEPGVYCVAVPVLDREDFVIAGISVSGSEVYLKPRKAEIAAMLLETSSRISRELYPGA